MRIFRRMYAAACAVGLLCLAVSGATGLSWRIYNKNESTWIYHPKGLMLFSTLSQTVKPVTIDAGRPIDTLIDCIEYDGYLWVSCNAGLYQIDEASQSVERIPLPESDSTATGKIAQDMDYMWLGTTGKLFRFDKLGREWFTFTLPQPLDRIVGLWSNGEEVFCLGGTILYRFTTATEKWNAYPLAQALGNDAIFYPGTSTFKVVDGASVQLYQPESFSWVKTDLGTVPIDIYDAESNLYCNYGTNVKIVNCVTGMIQPLNIPKTEGISSITVAGDSLIMVQPKRIASFSLTQENVNGTEYESGKTVADIQKILPLQTFIVMINEQEIMIYQKNTKVWQYIPRTAMEQKVKTFTWNEEECALRYGNGYKTVISGNLESGITFKSAGKFYDTTISVFSDTMVDSSQSLFTISNPKVFGNLTLHTTDKEDRVADVFFDNTSFVTAPKKGIYFRGNKNDYLNTLKLGTTDNDQMAGLALPKVDMEGASVVLESKKRLAKRDRKVARLAGGSGVITSRTITKKLPYRSDGTYYLLDIEEDTAALTDTTMKSDITIIPGSIKVMVDGALIDTTYYNLYSSIGKLEFNTSSPVDPVSSITVEYQVQPRPDKKNSEDEFIEVEFIPKHNFGTLHYGTVTVSPNEWISARVGYTGIDRDSFSSIISASTPIELRNDTKKLMLKATPEFSYNTSNGTKAGGTTLQSRIGERTGFVFNTRFVDENFVSTDTLTTGLGVLRHEYDGTLTYDIRQELPLQYYQHQRFADNGSENRYEFKAGVHYTNYPFLDMTLSRTTFEKNEDELEVNAYDSMFHQKDKLHLRLYETSAKKLEKLTHFSKIAYEFAHSEYRSTTRSDVAWNGGRVSTLQFTLIPVQKVILLGEMLYRGSIEMEGAPSADFIPRLSFQFMDFPTGVDISGYYFINNKQWLTEQTSTDTIMRSVRVVLRPGQWYAPLGWFSPRAQLSQNIQSTYARTSLSLMQLITGDGGIFNASDIVKELGVNIFPIDGLMITNTNRWVGNSVKSGTKFQTNNRMQWVFDSRNILTATYNYTGENPNYLHNALILYEKTWNSWLRTSPALLVDAKKDSTGTLFAMGPKFIFNLNFQNISILRMLNNIHDFSLIWNKIDGVAQGAPDIGYNFSLRLKIKPNLELSNIEQLQFKNGEYDSFISRINLFVYF